jgi:flagellin-like hook-associated protein FlgL
MGVSGISGQAAMSLQAISDMRNQLDDLQRQLGTGMKADSYAGLGLNRGLTVGLRSQLAAMSSYQDNITQAGVRLNLMQTALTQFDNMAQKTKSTILQSQYVLNGAQTADQNTAASVLDQMLGALNTGVDGHYLFSGSTVNQEPVDTADHILNGDGVKAGLIQVIDERKQADLGSNGLGRLVVSMPSATSVAVDEDSVSPFGFKLVGVTTTMSGATVTQPTGVPPSMSVDVASATPSNGDIVKLTFTLPDGSSRDLTLTATSSSPPGAGQFSIGPTPTDTANSLQAAVTAGLGTLANTELVAASALAAGNDFFNTDASHPPQRVAGPPFDTATALTDGSADTVAWYTGDNATNDPRSTSIVRADQSLTVAYGARANEQAFRLAVQNMAVFAAAQFSGSDPNAAGQYSALRSRVGANLNGTPGQQKVSDIAGQLAGAQVALNNAKDRQDQTSTTLQNLLQSVQSADPSDVAAQILALQTSLQATLQTTAMLLQTNLLKYMS